MEQKTHSPKFLRQRKFLVVLPFLVLPFLTFGFWALGGGKARQSAVKSEKGLNIELPGAALKASKDTDKMSYYAQADKDSAMLRDQRKNDPFYAHNSDSQLIDLDQERLGFNGSDFTSNDKENGGLQNRTLTDANEQKVYQKLDRLNAALNQNQQQATGSGSGDFHRSGQTIAGGDVDRLEKMMESMQSGGSADPEMAQLNSILERISEVQNPGLVQEKLRQASAQKKGRVFAVSPRKKNLEVSSLDQPSKGFSYEDTALKLSGGQNGFFAYDIAADTEQSENAVSATIAETQVVVSGSTVKMKLATDIFINGTMIPKGNLVYGVASLAGERLSVKISSIRHNNNLFPVELNVYDMDGLEGLYIPGAINRDVAKESADRGLQNIGFSSLDPSIGMQAASVGVEAAKSLFSRKVKLVRVTIKAGYQLLLRDEKQKQQN